MLDDIDYQRANEIVERGLEIGMFPVEIDSEGVTGWFAGYLLDRFPQIKKWERDARGGEDAGDDG